MLWVRAQIEEYAIYFYIFLHFSKLNRNFDLTPKLLPLENISKNEKILIFVWYFAHLIVTLQTVAGDRPQRRCRYDFMAEKAFAIISR